MKGIHFSDTISIMEYLALRDAVQFNRISEKQAESGLRGSAFITVAVNEEGCAVGMARVVSDGGYVAYIADVFVHPNYQRQGIGKAMMRRVMEYLQMRMEVGEEMFVTLMAAKGKEPFYEGYGFFNRPNERYGHGMMQWLKKTEETRIQE